MAHQSPIVVLGSGPWAGAYLLKINLVTALSVRFGSFMRGAPLALAPGHLVYVGSAQGRGAPLLARVRRHLTRTASQPPQPLWPEWQAFLARQNVRLGKQSAKRLRWHIDYLLDDPAAQITQVVLLPASQPIEQPLAAHLEAMACTTAPVTGLGASDHPGHTHLLGWHGSTEDWQSLLATLSVLAEKAEPP